MNTIPNRPRVRRRWPAVLVTGAALAVLAGCATTGPLVVWLEYKGALDLNGGYACRVRVYQLKTDANFMVAPPETFWGRAPAAFEATDLAAPREEVMLEPGEDFKVDITISEETRYIGAAADFRRPDRSVWRTIRPFSEAAGRELMLSVSARGIEIKF